MGWETREEEGRPGSVRGAGPAGVPGQPEGSQRRGVQRSGEQVGQGEGGLAFSPHSQFRAMKSVLFGLTCKFYQASSVAGQIAGHATLCIRNC